MTNHDIASFLLQRVTRGASPVVFAGEIQHELGSDAFGEALRLGWLRPDLESGALQIASDATSIGQMRTLVSQVGEAQEGDYQVGDEVMVTSNGKPAPGRIKKVNSDGSYELDFGTAGQANPQPFRREQMKPVSRPTTANQPPGSSVPPRVDNVPLSANPQGKVTPENPAMARYPIGR